MTVRSYITKNKTVINETGVYKVTEVKINDNEISLL